MKTNSSYTQLWVLLGRATNSALREKMFKWRMDRELYYRSHWLCEQRLHCQVHLKHAISSMYSPVDSGSLCDCTGISTDDSDSHGSRHSSWAGIQTQRSTKERRRGGGGAEACCTKGLRLRSIVWKISRGSVEPVWHIGVGFWIIMVYVWY